MLREVERAARRHGWQIESLPVSSDFSLLTLRRAPAEPKRRIYLSTGIHGDEPAGPLAALRLIEENLWPADVEVLFCPCLNPAGFELNSRENERGRDLNRDYKHLESDEIRAHVAWLQQQAPFDLTICLHEDWEAHGFYLYELNPGQRPSQAGRVITEVARVCPIDTSPEIDGRPARGGIIHPELDPLKRPQWPEAFWLVQHKTRLSYTLEAPSDFPMATRVAALVTAVRAILNPM